MYKNTPQTGEREKRPIICLVQRVFHQYEWLHEGKWTYSGLKWMKPSYHHNTLDNDPLNCNLKMPWKRKESKGSIQTRSHVYAINQLKRKFTKRYLAKVFVIGSPCVSNWLPYWLFICFNDFDVCFTNLSSLWKMKGQDKWLFTRWLKHRHSTLDLSYLLKTRLWKRLFNPVSLVRKLWVTIGGLKCLIFTIFLLTASPKTWLWCRCPIGCFNEPTRLQLVVSRELRS